MPLLENRKYIVANFVYGFGPFSKVAELAIRINNCWQKEGGKRFGIIIPLVYGEDQMKILKEDFQEIIKKFPDEILVDEKLGEILRSLFYSGDEGFEKSLEAFVSGCEKAEEEVRKYFKSGIIAKTLSGREIKISAKDIAFELSRCPRMRFPVATSFYTGFGYISEILNKAVLESDIDLDKNLLKKASKIFEKIESSNDLCFVSEPGTFFSHDYKKRRKSEILTPPTLSWPIEENKEKIKKGVYVTISGIPGLNSLYGDVKKLGMDIYTNKPSALGGAGEKRSPDFVSNKNIILHFARTGWGSVWMSLLNEAPLVTMPFKHNDDPEIYFNNKMLEGLGLVKIYSGERFSELLEFAKSFKFNAKKMNDYLLNKYNTLDGNSVIAREVVGYLKNNQK